MDALRIQAVSKYFQDITALKDLSFSIEQGRLVGLLGINGAGKTTLMRILTGTLLADEGEVRVAGHSLLNEPLIARRLIGYLGEFPSLYGTMTLYEYLHFVAGLKGIFPVKTKILLNLCEELELTERLSHPLQTFSKGFKQRASLAAALIGNPPILLLDEPSTGLDPKQANEFRKKILSLKGKQTILFSSHLLHEIEMVSDEVKLLHQGTLLEPKPSKEWSLVLKIQAPAENALKKQLNHLLKQEQQKQGQQEPYEGNIPKLSSLLLTWKQKWLKYCLDYTLQALPELDQMYKLTINFKADGEAESHRMASFLNNLLLAQGISVSTLVIKQPSLEEQFLGLLQEQPSDIEVGVRS